MILDCLSKAIFMFFIYNAIALLLFGVPKSLSMTYYLFKDRVDTLKWLFPSMMTLLAVFLMPCWLEISEGSPFQFTAFLSAAGVLFVGAAPAFKSSSLENMVHQVSAYICAAAAIAWICLVTPYWWIILIVLAVIALLAYVTKTIKSSYIYWLEMVAFISTFISIVAYYEQYIK
jgi:hypothetical protein